MHSTKCGSEDKQIFIHFIGFLFRMPRFNQIIQLSDINHICLFISWQSVELQTFNWIQPKFLVCFAIMGKMQLLISFPQKCSVEKSCVLQLIRHESWPLFWQIHLQELSRKSVSAEGIDKIELCLTYMFSSLAQSRLLRGPEKTQISRCHCSFLRSKFGYKNIFKGCSWLNSPCSVDHPNHRSRGFEVLFQ